WCIGSAAVNRLRVLFALPRCDLVWALMQKGDDRLAAFGSIPVLFLRVAHPVRSQRAIPPGHDDDVVIAVVDHAFDQRPLVLVCRGKEFHAAGDAVQLQERLYYLLTLLLKVLKR